MKKMNLTERKTYDFPDAVLLDCDAEGALCTSTEGTSVDDYKDYDNIPW